MQTKRLYAFLLILAALCASGCMPAHARRGDAVVATDHPIASAAGAQMLRLGGNAVDAAVAASFCLSVVRPESCGIGGGGFMLIHLRGGEGREPISITLNYRETAPKAVGPDYFTPTDEAHHERSSTLGGSAVAVPGTVAGLLHALENYGRLDRETVLAPAIRAAEQGFEVDAHFLGAARRTARLIEQTPDGPTRFRFLYEDFLKRGEIALGERITNPQKAETLRLIALHGRDAIYSGPIAEAIVEAVQADGGSLTLSDLADYSVRETQPLRGRFQEFEVLAMPPPSSGGVAILQILGVLQEHESELGRGKPGEARYTHLLTEAMKHAFADRARWMADPRFAIVPTDELLSSPYLRDIAARIDMRHASEPDQYGSYPPDDGGTSHISVIDSNGNAVACTETINLSFGSKLAVEAYGFLLNNEMDDFLTVPGEANEFGLTQSRRNLPEAGKQPLSSMSPTIVLRGGRPVLAVGASGGPRIISATVQVILNTLLYDQNIDDAVAHPRLHHQWQPNLLRLEEGYADQATRETLRALGHQLEDYSDGAAVQAVRYHNGRCIGASDPRKGGRPAAHDEQRRREPGTTLGVHLIFGGRS